MLQFASMASDLGEWMHTRELIGGNAIDGNA
jgi:hypothetical protein